MFTTVDTEAVEMFATVDTEAVEMFATIDRWPLEMFATIDRWRLEMFLLFVTATFRPQETATFQVNTASGRLARWMLEYLFPPCVEWLVASPGRPRVHC